MHYSCGFANDLYFENGTFQLISTLVQTNKIGVPCYICEKKSGLILKCSHSGCTRSFHGECGRRNNLSFQLQKQYPYHLNYCGDHTLLEFSMQIKKKELKLVSSIEKYYLQLKKFIKQNREVLQIVIRRDSNKKSRKYKKNKKLLPRKYSRIIDEVNSIKEGVGFISIIELNYIDGQFHFGKIRR